MSLPIVEPVAEAKLLSYQARVIRGFAVDNARGITHEESLVQPEPTGNCANWVLGHMTNTYESLLPLLGQEPVLAKGALQRYRRGSLPMTDPSEAVDFGALLETWVESAKRIERGLESVTGDALEQREDYFGNGDPLSLKQFFSFFMCHQSYHAGQLGLLRRIVGKEGAI